VAGTAGVSAMFAVMPARRPDPARLLAAVNEQRAAIGAAPWSGPADVSALGLACLRAVLAALDGGRTPEREALRGAVGYLLGLLATDAPGRAVEVRIPPHAAIQCVAGPRHTRGTPPNVVETDAVTWILLATGRISWGAAVADGRLRASGSRADISGYLPLVADATPADRNQ
jgi:Bacterial SCP ortholog